MFYVYILQSISSPSKTYVGYSSDLKNRFKEHNSGKSTFTNKFKPWKIVCYLGFEKEESAKNFEIYLKTGSGIAFRKKRFR